MRNEVEVRPAKREAWCRVCDQRIRVGQVMVSWYSHRNQGQHIHICVPCCIEIYARLKLETSND